jgi:hypothetical protein
LLLASIFSGMVNLLQITVSVCMRQISEPAAPALARLKATCWATLVWRWQLSHRHRGYEAVDNFLSSGEVEVSGMKVGYLLAL